MRGRVQVGNTGRGAAQRYRLPEGGGCRAGVALPASDAWCSSSLCGVCAGRARQDFQCSRGIAAASLSTESKASAPSAAPSGSQSMLTSFAFPWHMAVGTTPVTQRRQSGEERANPLSTVSWHAPKRLSRVPRPARRRAARSGGAGGAGGGASVMIGKSLQSARGRSSKGARGGGGEVTCIGDICKRLERARMRCRCMAAPRHRFTLDFFNTSAFQPC
jgi:hypothetical protein